MHKVDKLVLKSVAATFAAGVIGIVTAVYGYSNSLGLVIVGTTAMLAVYAGAWRQVFKLNEETNKVLAKRKKNQQRTSYGRK